MIMTHPNPGVYCFNLGFTPTNVIATAEEGDQVVRATLDAGSVTGCSEDDEAAVLTFEFLPGEDNSFFILFQN
jgi:hypothetical protein